MRRKAARRSRQAHRDNQVAGFERGLALRRIAGQAMQFVQPDLATAVPALDLDDGIECDQGNAEIRGMRGDAALAPAEHGMIDAILNLLFPVSCAVHCGKKMLGGCAFCR